MKKVLGKPDVSLMSLALSISKKTATIATIKYGNVYLINGDIAVQLSFNLRNEQIHLLYIDEIDESYWILSIPLCKVASTKEIEDIICVILGVKRIKPRLCPFVSLPSNYYLEVIESGEVFFDSYLTPTDFMKMANYSISMIDCHYFLKIIVDERITTTKEIYIVPRSGLGNEDL